MGCACASLLWYIMVLEVAVAANCQYIVSFNVRDFVGSEQFGVQAITPKVFLQQLGVIP